MARCLLPYAGTNQIRFKGQSQPIKAPLAALFKATMKTVIAKSMPWIDETRCD
jgi:hypothetical protein